MQSSDFIASLQDIHILLCGMIGSGHLHHNLEKNLVFLLVWVLFKYPTRCLCFFGSFLGKHRGQEIHKENTLPPALFQGERKLALPTWLSVSHWSKGGWTPRGRNFPGDGHFLVNPIGVKSHQMKGTQVGS